MSSSSATKSKGPPPPPPKRKDRQATGMFAGAAVGSGLNVARASNGSSSMMTASSGSSVGSVSNTTAGGGRGRGGYSSSSSSSSSYSSSSSSRSNGEEAHEQSNKICLQVFESLPDSVVAANIEINGEVSFERLLRIDGKFEGKLMSQGDMIIGPYGLFVGDVTTLRQVVVDGGQIIGNVTCEELVMKGKAIVKGNVTCKYVALQGSQCSLNGRINIQPLAPELVDEHDNIITELAPKRPKQSVFKKIRNRMKVEVPIPPAPDPEPEPAAEPAVEPQAVPQEAAAAPSSIRSPSPPSPSKEVTKSPRPAAAVLAAPPAAIVAAPAVAVVVAPVVAAVPPVAIPAKAAEPVEELVSVSDPTKKVTTSPRAEPTVEKLKEEEKEEVKKVEEVKEEEKVKEEEMPAPASAVVRGSKKQEAPAPDSEPVVEPVAESVPADADANAATDLMTAALGDDESEPVAAAEAAPEPVPAPAAETSVPEPEPEKTEPTTYVISISKISVTGLKSVEALQMMAPDATSAHCNPYLQLDFKDGGAFQKFFVATPMLPRIGLGADDAGIADWEWAPDQAQDVTFTIPAADLEAGKLKLVLMNSATDDSSGGGGGSGGTFACQGECSLNKRISRADSSVGTGDSQSHEVAGVELYDKDTSSTGAVASIQFSMTAGS